MQDASPRQHNSEDIAPASRVSLSWRSATVFALIVAMFLAARLPVALRQIPAQDEDYFAVPGWTILREGIPRIPYMPSRNPDGAFYKADEVLYTLPPLYFYWQAMIYGLFGASTGMARVASMAAGVAAIVLLHRLARRILHNESAALSVAGLYAFSRVLYFPCVIARPDMLCGMFGIALLVCLWAWNESHHAKWAIAAGACGGLGMLTHPFALVFCLQAAGWIGLGRTSWRNRLRDVLSFGITSLLCFSLWLPLIAIAPDVFRAQFFNNVLGRSGPGLLARLVWPWESLAAQAPLAWEHIGTFQLPLLAAASVTTTVIAWRTGDRSLRMLSGLIWSGVYLHVTCQGTHPTKGYWVYTTVPAFIAIGVVMERLASLKFLERVSGFVIPALGLSAAVLFIPGSGLRTVAAHVRHWNDINYDAPRFTQRLLDETPPHATYIVDPAYIFDFHRAGRNVLLGLDYPFFFSVRGHDYDVLVGGPYSIRDRVPTAVDARFVRAFGDADDLFACYAELYEPPTDNDAVPRSRSIDDAPEPDRGSVP